MRSNKILVVVGITLGLIGGIVVFVSKSNVSAPKSPLSLSQTLTAPSSPVTQATDISQYDFLRQSMMQALEASMAAVNKRIDDLAKKQTTTTGAVTNLPVTQVVTASGTPVPVTGPKAIYIPIGYGGSTSSNTGFADIAGQEVTIDPSNYPGYKQVVFEATFRIYQGNGTGEVRLGNKTDGTSFSASSLSTTSENYVTKSSSAFNLSGGSKTYVVQAKTSTGYSVDVQLTRIRIDF